MNVFAPMASRAPPSTGGIITRAHPGDDTAEPPLGAGFETVMAQSRDLQAATDRAVGLDDGPHASSVDRMLRDHHQQLGHNIALLEQRYEKGPAAGGSAVNESGPIESPAETPRLPDLAMDVERLSSLVTQHVEVIGSIETLLAENADGQRGELILSELASNHAEMATELAMVVADDDSARVSRPIAAGRTSATGGGNPENKSGRPEDDQRGIL